MSAQTLDLAAARAALERVSAALPAALAALSAADADGAALRAALARADAAEAQLRAARAEAAEMRVALDEALGIAMARKAEIATLRRSRLPGAVAGPAAPPVPGTGTPHVQAVHFAPVMRSATPRASDLPAVRPAEPVSAEVARIEDVFRTWCRDARPVVSQVRFFAEAIRRVLPEATVEPVYRDAYSQASPVVLSAHGGASPTEYWCVGVGGRHWLVPQPLGPTQFRELAPCLSGVATPATLARLQPAGLHARGDTFTLTHAGTVSATA